MIRRIVTLIIALAAVGLVQFPRAAEAQQGVSWQGQYFGNQYLINPAVVIRQDSAIWFDWGNNAPAQGIGSDGFSIRWAADPYFAAGTYRFWALADDNVRVTVDFAFHPQIDTFASPSIGQIVSGDVTLSAGIHHVQVDYREVSGSAYAYVTWANLATNPGGPGFPVPSQSFANVNNGQWTAQYYANASLSGSPSLIQSEAGPSHTWGVAAPAVNLPADNFSARWTSVQTLDAGSYQLSVRADDGVRVFVDGIAVMNEWHSATNLTYTAPLNLNAGQHNIMIEYYEAGGDAFLDYRLERQSGSPPPSAAPANTGTTAQVTAYRLNVRSAPTTSGDILIKINKNEVYPVVGSNADKSWYQLNINGVIGWVFGRFVLVSGSAGVPVVNSSAPTLSQPADTGYTVTGLATVNIRSQPSTAGAILGKLPLHGAANVVGRNGSNTWWQINYAGLVGWVSSTYAQIQPGVEIGRIPVTG
jgi:uncharacterized protein YgiM (DUF1202 family)